MSLFVPHAAAKIQQTNNKEEQKMEENTSFIPEIYIGENGNWFINNYDTGVPATGPKGEK